ncbi:MAG: FHA domain-containing protein [Acidobacteria bacterium]|nr:FHA domain-containing protein [Acidobacteriota bacterium]
MPNLLDNLESWFQSKISSATKQLTSVPKEKTLLEVCKAIQEGVRGRVLAQDKGIKVFPFTSIEIGIFAKDEEQRDSYEAVLTTDPPFTQRIEELILEEGCRVRGLKVSLQVSVNAAMAVTEQPYQLRFAKAPAAAPAGARPAARLVVMKGEAETNEVEIVSDRVNLGRLREVVSSSGSILRINQVAFGEGETSVAREHAFVRWDAAGGRFLLFDDISGSRGTRIFRGGETIALPRGASKGTALEDGDEIHLGSARVRFVCAGR